MKRFSVCAFSESMAPLKFAPISLTIVAALIALPVDLSACFAYQPIVSPVIGRVVLVTASHVSLPLVVNFSNPPVFSLRCLLRMYGMATAAATCSVPGDRFPWR